MLKANRISSNKLSQVGLFHWLASLDPVLVASLAVAGILLFLNLGNMSLGIDESNTATLAKNVLRFGYPRVWDGRNLVPPFFDGDVNADMAWTAHPWLQFYVAAASLFLFGPQDWALRLPFVLAAFLALPLLYFLAWQISHHQVICRIAVAMASLSAPYLLYARQARYYSLTFLFGIGTLLAYTKWSESLKKRHLLLFVVCSVLLFHSFYPFWIPLMLSILGYFLFLDAKRGKWLQFAAAWLVILIFTVPWFIYMPPATGPAGTKPDPVLIGTVLSTYVGKLQVYIFPFITLLILMAIFKFFSTIGWLSREMHNAKFHRTYILLIVPMVLQILVVSMIPIATTQYLAPLLPLGFILVAFSMVWMRELGRTMALFILALLVFTNLLNLLPYVALERLNLEEAPLVTRLIKTPQCDATLGAPLPYYARNLDLRFYFFDFVNEVTQDYDNRVEGIVRCLQGQGRPDETVLVWWGEANAIAFHTDMHVIYHFIPTVTDERIISLVYETETSPDWIIPEGFNIPIEPHFRYDRNQYEQINIAYPKVWFDNSPNLDDHHFCTVTDAPGFYILRRIQR